jgi:hypothetical protein
MEVGQGPNVGCSAKGKKIGIIGTMSLVLIIIRLENFLYFFLHTRAGTLKYSSLVLIIEIYSYLTTRLVFRIHNCGISDV